MAKGGSAPVYDSAKSWEGQQKAAQLTSDLARYNLNTAGGGIEWGDDGYTVSDSPVGGQIRNLQGKLASGMITDPSEATSGYYSSMQDLLRPGQERSRENETIRLANQGIPVGSEAYNEAMTNFDQNQSLTNQALANEAVFKGQDYVGSQIRNLGGLGGALSQESPTNEYIPGIGAYNFTDPYDKQYQGQMNAYNTKSAGGNAMWGTLGSMAGAGAGMYMASDKRLKENLIPVGKLDNGLTVYIGNYKKGLGLDEKTQLFLIAQEVKKKVPKAVKKVGKWLAVDYKKAVKNGK